jgi:hypothetical protein
VYGFVTKNTGSITKQSLNEPRHIHAKVYWAACRTPQDGTIVMQKYIYRMLPFGVKKKKPRELPIL